MAVIFDGRKFAAEKEANLKFRVLGLKTRGVYPKLASIIVGNDPASELYVGLKKKAAQRIGAEVDIYLVKANSSLKDLIFLIKTLNEDKTVNGIMIQMPLPPEMANDKTQIINSIAAEKDVDGLRDGSPYLHPTSKAIADVLRLACSKYPCKSVVVVGAKGMVGAPLVRELKWQKYEVTECGSKTKNLKEETLQSDAVISCTGIPNLITGGMVKEGAVVIDVGSPRGDVEFDTVLKKAGFITPVPGGIGPVTITCLLENLIAASG